MHRYLVYGLVDPRDRLVYYIGKSSSGLSRPRQHSLYPRTHGQRLQSWIDELHAVGMACETVVLESVCDPRAPSARCWWLEGRNSTELAAVEQWWIAYGRACLWPLCNMTDGGDGRPGYRMSDKLKNALRQRNQIYWSDPERRRLVGERLQAHRAPMTPEIAAKISKANFGRKRSNETRARHRANHAARTPEQRSALARKAAANWSREARLRSAAALSRRNNARVWTDEMRAKVARALQGYRHTPEARANMSVAMQARWDQDDGSMRERSRARRVAWNQSPEMRAKVSRAHRGKVMPREAVERIADKLRGRKRDPASIAKTVASFQTRREKLIVARACDVLRLCDDGALTERELRDRIGGGAKILKRAIALAIAQNLLIVRERSRVAGGQRHGLGATESGHALMVVGRMLAPLFGCAHVLAQLPGGCPLCRAAA